MRSGHGFLVSWFRWMTTTELQCLLRLIREKGCSWLDAPASSVERALHKPTSLLPHPLSGKCWSTIEIHRIPRPGRRCLQHSHIPPSPADPSRVMQVAAAGAGEWRLLHGENMIPSASQQVQIRSDGDKLEEDGASDDDGARPSMSLWPITSSHSAS